jgi:hypothetical protein
MVCTAERRHGSTRVPGHAFLASRIAYNEWLCTFTILQQLDISLAHSWAAPVRATGPVWKCQEVRPAHRVQNHTCRVTLFQPAMRAAVLASPL